MALRLTPEMLEAAYELLRTTPPFRRWRLPHADEIEFRVTRLANEFAHYLALPGRRHRIAVAEIAIERIESLALHMAHEMVHLKQQLERSSTRNQHNARFVELSRQVCRHHGFEFKRFV